jgi:hypothetical protein
MAQSPNGIPSTNNSVQSISRQARYEPFELQVSRGQITGHSLVNIFGFGSTVASPTAGVYYPAWENTNTPAYYVFPTTAQVMYVASTVSGDSGALIQVNGLDKNYNSISEIVTLGGTANTGVATVKSYFRINNITVSTATPVNPTGVITIQNQAATSGAVEYAQINTSTLNGSTVSNGTSQMSVYTVPAGFSLYLSRFTANTSYTGNTANYTLYRAVAYYPSVLNSSATFVNRIVLQTPFVTEYNIQRIYPFFYPQGTDIVWQFAPSGTVAVSVGINIGGVLIDNGS